MRFAIHDGFVYTEAAFDHMYLQVSLLCLPTGNRDKFKPIDISQLNYVFGHLCRVTLTLALILLDFAIIHQTLTESTKLASSAALVTSNEMFHRCSWVFEAPSTYNLS